MANKRIHDLTDTQSSYDADIYVASDDSTFTNTKKMKVSTIYPKTNTLSAVGDYNPDTTLLRTDNGSGSENKATVTDLLSDSDTTDVLKDNLGPYFAQMRLRLTASVSSIGVASKINGDLSVSATKPSTGRYVITHNLGNTNYMVIANTVTDISTVKSVGIGAIYQASGDMVIHTSTGATVTDADFRFSIFEYTI